MTTPADKETRRGLYTKLIFRLILAGSAVSLAAMLKPRRSGKFFKAFEHFTAKELWRLRRALMRLERNRLVEIVEKGDVTEVRFTADGKKKADRMLLRNLQISHPRTWDGKWRLVIFDVPEYLRLLTFPY